MIPFPPTTTESEEPVFEESSIQAALENIGGGSHSVNTAPVEPVEEAPLDLNNLDVAALGESLGLDPSNSRRRKCYPDYDEHYPEPDYDCYDEHYPEPYDYKKRGGRDYRSPDKYDKYYPEEEYHPEEECYPKKYYQEEKYPKKRGGKEDYYGKPEKCYYDGYKPDNKKYYKDDKKPYYKPDDKKYYKPEYYKDDKYCKCKKKRGAIDDCLPTDKTIKNLELKDVLCDDKTECERYCQTPDYGELNFGHAGARSNQG